MPKTLYLLVEYFKNKDAVPVYRRFRDHGRMAPEGLTYVSSWVDQKLERCYPLMERTNSGCSTNGCRSGTTWSSLKLYGAAKAAPPQKPRKRDFFRKL